MRFDEKKNENIDFSHQSELDGDAHGLGTGFGRLNFTGDIVAVGGHWASHLANSPGKQAELWRLRPLSEQWMSLLKRRIGPNRTGEPLDRSPVNDRRFNDPACGINGPTTFPQFIRQSDQMVGAGHAGCGVLIRTQRLLAFGAKQWLEMVSPANAALFQPGCPEKNHRRARRQSSAGTSNFLDDLRRQLSGQPPREREISSVGRDVAVTEGKVVLRNRLIELIQYTPTTEKVHPEPIMIIPAWIA